MANRQDDDRVEALAQKLYEARHPSSQWPSWAELQHQKTYKLAKYRQLAEVAIAFLKDQLGQP